MHQGKRIFVTGGGSGLGKAVAFYFAQQGYKVALGDIDKEALQATKDELGKVCSDVLVFECDTTSEESMRQARSQIEEAWNGLDVLVNNAGIAGKYGIVEETKIEDWQKVLNVNLLGVVRGCMVFADMFKHQRSGAVVNIASMAGLLTPPEASIYNTSKAAVIALTESLQFELAPFDVTAHAVCPAFFKTNLTSSLESNPNAKRFVEKEMDRSSITATDVARMIFETVHTNKLMLLTHPRERRIWRLKRFLPNLYQKLAMKTFDKLLKKTRSE